MPIAPSDRPVRAHQDYIGVKNKCVQYLPHSAGRWSKVRFRKAQCPIIERLTCSLMMHGRNNGKKLLAVRIIKHTLEIIHLLTDQNPIQVGCDVCFAAPSLNAIACRPCLPAREDALVICTPK